MIYYIISDILHRDDVSSIFLLFIVFEKIEVKIKNPNFYYSQGEKFSRKKKYTKMSANYTKMNTKKYTHAFFDIMSRFHGIDILVKILPKIR